MRELTQTQDPVYALSVRMALEARGIAAVVNEPPFASERVAAAWITILIPNDADFERARAALAEVVQSPSPLLFSRADIRRMARVLFRVGVVAVLVAAAWVLLSRR